jgi:SAM-dependent methyltransferase
MTGLHPDRASGTEGYGETADVLVKHYEEVTFAQVHRDTLHLMPAAPCRALDIGAGTGCDAAALAALGHRVVAVEPTAELRAHGQRLHRAAAIDWIDDALPGLDEVHARLKGGSERFDLVLLTGVWMHLDAAERTYAMARVAGLLAPAALMTMQLRHGLVPAGRRMFEVSATETRDLAGHHGLVAVHDSERPALLGGSAVWWSVLAFRAPG